ncbi:MAG: helix-turn-helix transcriptional regulator [Candidatus Omnitrophica bacterium]|nr:helix-turn-helix transcriptional regulator [Candidatus Omnitrophota bacterium]
MDYPKAIRVLMAKAGIETQMEVAERSGLHCNTVSVVMNGPKNRVVHVVGFAKAFGIKPSELLMEAESYPDSPEETE